MSDISQNKPKNDERKYYMFALKIAGDFGFTIAAPVVVFALIGQKIDDRYNTKPLFLIIGMIIAAILTGLMIYKKAKTYGKQFQDLDKSN